MGTNVPSLRTILKILLGNDSDYNSDDIDYHAPPRTCYHIDGEVLHKEVPGLKPPD